MFVATVEIDGCAPNRETYVWLYIYSILSLLHVMYASVSIARWTDWITCQHFSWFSSCCSRFIVRSSVRWIKCSEQLNQNKLFLQSLPTSKVFGRYRQSFVSRLSSDFIQALQQSMQLSFTHRSVRKKRDDKSKRKLHALNTLGEFLFFFSSASLRSISDRNTRRRVEFAFRKS